MLALVVDDNLANTVIASAILRRIGFTVSLAASGAEALGLVSEKHYDFILMDFHMPGINGAETTLGIRFIEGDCLRVPSFVLEGSASCDAEIKRAFIDAGANLIIEKPFSPFDLHAVVQQHFPVLAGN